MDEFQSGRSSSLVISGSCQAALWACLRAERGCKKKKKKSKVGHSLPPELGSSIPYGRKNIEEEGREGRSWTSQRGYFAAWKSQVLPLGCCGDPTGNRNPTGFPHSLAVPRGRASLAGAKALGNAAAPQNLIPSLCPAHSSSLQKHHPTPNGSWKLPLLFLSFFSLLFLR